MTAAPDFDPYLLPLPAPDSPVLPHRVSSLHAHLNGRYADPVWPLAPLTRNPSVTKVTIGWERWPAAFRDEMRLAAWNLINGQLRPAFLQERGTGMRSRLSLNGVYDTTEHWKAFARWLGDEGMRPGEILGLRTGCCPDPVPGPDGQAGRHLIRGFEFKTATDEDGNHESGGTEREVPWVAINLCRQRYPRPRAHGPRRLSRALPARSRI